MCRCAALALQSIDRRVLYGQEVRVNWASQRDTRPDTSNHFHIFIGDLAAEVRISVHLGLWCAGNIYVQFIHDAELLCISGVRLLQVVC